MSRSFRCDGFNESDMQRIESGILLTNISFIESAQNALCDSANCQKTSGNLELLMWCDAASKLRELTRLWHESAAKVARVIGQGT